MLSRPHGDVEAVHVLDNAEERVVRRVEAPELHAKHRLDLLVRGHPLVDRECRAEGPAGIEVELRLVLDVEGHVGRPTVRGELQATVGHLEITLAGRGLVPVGIGGIELLREHGTHRRRGREAERNDGREEGDAHGALTDGGGVGHWFVVDSHHSDTAPFTEKLSNMASRLPAMPTDSEDRSMVKSSVMPRRSSSARKRRMVFAMFPALRVRVSVWAL